MRPLSPACVFLCGLLAGCGGPAGPPSPCAALSAPPPAPVPDTCRLPDLGPDDGTVRVFVIGSHLRLPRDYGDFCRAHDDLVREQVLPCLSRRVPNLVVFPEDAGLPAAFIGPRAERARAEGRSLAAFSAILSGYLDAFGLYQERYGAGFGRALSLALTDTVWRAVDTTFAGLAKSYGVYVMTSANVARVAPVTGGPEYEALKDPARPADEPVFAPASGDVYNAALLYGPDGSLLHRFDKAYLVPTEQELLALSPGPISGLRPVAVPGLPRISAVTSKDAWMRDVVDRLDAWGAELVVQPEAFSGWGIEEYPGDWLPDVVKQSGWSDAQHFGSMRAVLVPCLTGNFFDLVFDGQSHIAVPGRPGDRRLGFVGQEPDIGFAAVGPWAAPDPGESPGLTLAERRQRLRQIGEALRPGGSRADQYAESVVAADLRFATAGDLRPADGPAPFGEERPLSPGPQPQRNAAVALDPAGRLAAVVYEEGPPGGGRIVWLASTDGGATFGPREVLSGPASARRPVVALGGPGALVAWEEDTPTGTQVAYRVFDQMQGRFAAALYLSGELWDPDVAIDPAAPPERQLLLSALKTGAGNRPVLYAGGSPLMQVATVPSPEAGVRGNAYAVRVAARRGTVRLAFLDFRAASWDLYQAVLVPGSPWTVGAIERVNPPGRSVRPPGAMADVELERLHADPALRLDDQDRPVLAWSDLGDRQPLSRLAVQAPGPAGTPETTRLSPLQGGPVFAPALALSQTGRRAVVYQAGANHIELLAGDRGGWHGPRRLSTPGATWRYRPRVALADSGLGLAVWEDRRQGLPAIFISRFQLP